MDGMDYVHGYILEIYPQIKLLKMRSASQKINVHSDKQLYTKLQLNIIIKKFIDKIQTNSFLSLEAVTIFDF